MNPSALMIIRPEGPGGMPGIRGMGPYGGGMPGMGGPHMMGGPPMCGPMGPMMGPAMGPMMGGPMGMPMMPPQFMDPMGRFGMRGMHPAMMHPMMMQPPMRGMRGGRHRGMFMRPRMGRFSSFDDMDLPRRHHLGGLRGMGRFGSYDDIDLLDRRYMGGMRRRRPYYEYIDDEDDLDFDYYDDEDESIGDDEMMPDLFTDYSRHRRRRNRYRYGGFGHRSRYMDDW